MGYKDGIDECIDSYDNEFDCDYEFDLEDLKGNFNFKDEDCSDDFQISENINCDDKNDFDFDWNFDESYFCDDDKEDSDSKVIESIFSKGFEKGKHEGYEKGKREGYEKGIKEGYKLAKSQLLSYMKKNNCCIKCKNNKQKISKKKDSCKRNCHKKHC